MPTKMTDSSVIERLKPTKFNSKPMFVDLVLNVVQETCQESAYGICASTLQLNFHLSMEFR